MSNRAAIVERLCDRGIIAVIRAAGSEQLVDVAKALLDGGVDCIEFTMTTPNALEVITACCDSIGQTALIGVGSVLDAATAGRAIQAGAKFVISPVFNPQVIAAGHSADLPVVPGAYTPT